MQETTEVPVVQPAVNPAAPAENRKSSPTYQLHGHGALRFNGFGHEASENAPYMVVKSTSDNHSKGSHTNRDRTVGDAWKFMRDQWKLEDPKMIISVTGGAKRFYMKQRLLDKFKRGLMKAATSTDAWIITGGTQSGVMELVGEAVRDHMLQNGNYEQQLVVLGIAVLGVVTNYKQLRSGATEIKHNHRLNLPPAPLDYNFEDGLNASPKQNFLDPHHTHFILVDDGSEKYGGEIDFRAKFESRKHLKNATEIPVVSLVLEGGPNTLQTAAEAMDAGTAVVVFAGSGRAADFIAAAYDSQDLTSTKIMTLARKLYADNDPQLEKKAQESIDLVYRMLQKPHLLTIYKADSENSHDIDQEILNAVLKANGMQMDKKTLDFQSWKRCVQLAIDWNNCEVARHNIFNAENRSYWQEDRSFIDEMLLDVLINDKDEFVVLFLDSGINLKKFLTQERLDTLYEKTLKTSGVIGGLVKNFMSHADSQYFTCSCFKKKKSSELQHKLICKMLNKLTNHLYISDYLQGDCPERELFIWAVLFNRMSMARLFWKVCRDHIGAALVANMLLKQLSAVANKFEEFQLGDMLEANAREFEKIATGVLDECYKCDQLMSHRLLIRGLDLWANRSLFSMSDTASQMDFMVHDCCQTKLTKIWFGKMAIYTPIWMIIIGIVCPVLVLPFIEFDYRNDDVDTGGHPCTSSCRVGAQDDLEAQKTKVAGNKKNGNDDDDDDDAASTSGVGSDDALVRRTNGCSKLNHAITKMTEFYKAPIVKFTCHTLSYLCLVGLFSYFLMIELKPGQPSTIEIIVWAWSLTLAVEMLREVFTREEKRGSLKLIGYYSNQFNQMKLSKFVLMVIAVILRYVLTGDNFVWARNVYTITIILYYLRILQLFFVERNLGPKVIMIRLMLRDLVFFLFLLFIFMFALGVASQALMYPNSDPTWSVLFNVVYYPYYAVYQQYPMDQLLGQVANCSNDYAIYSDPNMNVPRCSELSWLINVLFACYVLIIGIMLLNILIAVFSYTFNNVQDVSETTWSFHRYSLTKEYHDKPTLVPPLIIINHVWRFVGFIYQKYTGQWLSRNDFKLRHDTELYKRLTAFERAGMENFLHRKRGEEQEETSWKTNLTLKKLDRIVVSVDTCKEQVQKLGVVPMSGDREASFVYRPAPIVSALAVALNEKARNPKPEEGKSHERHRCKHKKALSKLSDRMNHIEESLTSQNHKIDTIIEYLFNRHHSVDAQHSAARVSPNRTAALEAD